MQQLKNALTAKGILHYPYELCGITGIQFWIAGKQHFYLEGGSQFKLRWLLQIIAQHTPNT